VVPGLVVEPASADETASVLREADAAGLAVIPRGGGSKLSWGNPPSRADVLLSLARLNRILEHAWADLTVTVEAGCTIATLQAALAEHGQRLAIDLLWPERATIGGCLAANDSGARRLRYGGLRDLTIGVTLALPDGTLAASGGKVVKNVAGYDLPKLATGSLGTLGVITRATFRLHPLPRASMSLTLRPSDAAETQQLVLAALDSQLAPSALQVRAAGDSWAEIDILFEGTAGGLDAQGADLRELVGTTPLQEAGEQVWATRAQLWSRSAHSGAFAIAKLTFLPADTAATITAIERHAGGVAWQAVLQATGIGHLRLDGAAEAVLEALAGLRGEFERSGGSLVVLEQPAGPTRMEAWGAPGDALPLMRALKQQLDPRGTLNPGRFVGGI
jgi:glycolate oxidase FAD binding subunit